MGQKKGGENRVVVLIGPVDICTQGMAIVDLKTQLLKSYPHHGLPYFQDLQFGL
jgi:hypothetical protein